MKPIAMKCTQEQYDKIRPILLQNDFKESEITSFLDYSYLVNNRFGKNKLLSNLKSPNDYDRTVFEEWNEDIFLEYCGIKKEENMFTIEDLAEGKCAVTNDGTLEELREILRLAFPKDPCDTQGKYKYYFKKCNSNNWDTRDKTNLPKQSVKDFLKQINMYKYTPEYCKNNKVAIFIKTQSDIDGLNKLNCKGHIVSLKDFPNGFYTFPINDTWEDESNINYVKSNYEIIDASEFIKNNTNMENKEIIGYKLIKPEYRKVVAKIIEEEIDFNGRGFDNLSLRTFINQNSIKLLRQAGILDLWFEPVYKLSETKYTMGSNNDTFELVVRDGKCFHKEEDITNYVKDVQEFAKKLPKKFGNYDFIIDIESIEINKTGCQSCTSLLSQWLNIKL